MHRTVVVTTLYHSLILSSTPENKKGVVTTSPMLSLLTHRSSFELRTERCDYQWFLEIIFSVKEVLKVVGYRKTSVKLDRVELK